MAALSGLATYGKTLAARAKTPEDTREKDLISQFAQTRSRIAGQRAETERQANQSLNRLQAVAGGTGGAVESARQRAIRDIGTSFGDVEAGLGAQESQARQQLASQKIAEKFQFDELEENKKTNLINAAVALNEAGLDNDKRWQSLLSRYFGSNFGDPRSSGQIRTQVAPATAGAQKAINQQFFGNR